MFKFSAIRTFFALFAALFILSQTGCLTISENYTFKPNGSGTMEYMIDMSELSSLLAMAKEEGDSPMDEEINMGEIASKLEGIDGISKIESIENKESYIFGVSFKFSSIKALNDAMNAFMLDGENAGNYHTFFAKDGKTITRKHMLNNELNPADLLGGDDDSSEESMMLLESMKYKVNFKFKKPVKAVYSAADASFADAKSKEVAMEANFRQIMDDVEVLNATITTK